MWAMSGLGAMVVITGLLHRITDYDCHGATVTVTKGDTIWDIVVENCSGNIRFAQNDVLSKYGAMIHPGDVLVLP